MESIKGKSSFITMIFSVVAVVLWVALFESVLAGLAAILNYANIATFTVLETVVEISATVLLISGMFAAGFGYYKGAKGAAAQDASGILRMVFGIILIILFVTLFLTILASFYTLYSHANASAFTAFTTVVAIAPAVLFLGGLFGGATTAVSGARSFKRRKSSRL